MQLRDFFQKAIDAGIAHDPRGREAVLRDLSERRKEYDDLKQTEKDFFDISSLDNPYADSRILHGNGDEEIGSILAGIDIEVGEVLLADSLRAKGTRIDLIVSHHPEGSAFANLYSVMHMQSDILSRFGVPINIAEDLMDKRVREVERRLMPANHTRAVDAARLLNIPFVCLHTPGDNMVASFLQKTFDAQKPATLGDVTDLLRAVPEYRQAAINGAGPKILIGSKNRQAGKIFVDMTGGTEGPREIFSSLTTAGVNTIVAMHLSEDHRKEAEKHHLNVVIAGHISSDNLGLNLLFDAVLPPSGVTVLACSGFLRTSRQTP